VVGLLGTVPLIWYEAHRAGARPVRAPHAGWLAAALVFFLYQAASAAWAPPGARLSSGVVDLACLAALTVGFYLHARQSPEVVARRVLWFLYASGAVFAFGALVLSGAGAQGRFAAFGGGPNVFVRLQVLAMLAAVVLVATGASKRLLVGVPVFAVCAVLSGSRGGLLAGVVVALVAVLLGGRTARRVAVGAALGILASLVTAYLLSPTVADLVQTRFVQQTTQQGYDSDRAAVWGQSLELAWHHPIVGTGLDGFYALVGTFTGIVYPHNYALAVAADGGVVGLLLLVTAISLWARTVRRAPVRDVLLLGFIAASAYVAVASLFSGGYYDARLAWCCAAVAAALAERRWRRGPEPATAPAASRSAPSRRRTAGNAPGGATAAAPGPRGRSARA